MSKKLTKKEIERNDRIDQLVLKLIKEIHPKDLGEETSRLEDALLALIRYMLY